MEPETHIYALCKSPVMIMDKKKIAYDRVLKN